jgi:NAD(P)-dependent dehydrogenase (short-subunit alcohol dehydrogenase family)
MTGAFDDKLVFISGGAGGIGGGLARAFVEAGARVVLGDLDADGAAAAAAPFGARAMAVGLDVMSADSWAAARDAALDRFGPVDILCNNAGISLASTELIDLPPERFDRIVAVNLRGTFNGVQCFGPAMRARGVGHIVNVASTAGLIANAGIAAYTATKFAIVGLSESLRAEMKPHGVGVSLLCPGLVRSAMTLASAASGRVREENMMDAIWVGRAVVQAVADRRFLIITHPSYKPAVEQRHRRMLAAFGEPAQPGYAGQPSLS